MAEIDETIAIKAVMILGGKYRSLQFCRDPHNQILWMKGTDSLRPLTRPKAPWMLLDSTEMLLQVPRYKAEFDRFRNG